jgi:hypothetical protein
LVRDGKGKYCSKACSDTKTLFLKGHASKATSGSFKSGKDHPKWQGWRYAGRHHKYRLLLLPNHPFADKRGYYREHRYVLEQKLGRYLTPNEEVHHIDGNGLNNDPSNLRLMKNKHYHLKLEHKLGTYKGAYLAMAKSHGRSNIH